MALPDWYSLVHRPAAAVGGEKSVSVALVSALVRDSLVFICKAERRESFLKEETCET